MQAMDKLPTNLGKNEYQPKKTLKILFTINGLQIMQVQLKNKLGSPF
jgi:hypothetical protein